MPQYIIHRNGAFNMFCTVMDAPYFKRALTKFELEDWYRHTYGTEGMRILPKRIERAIETGTSAIDDTLVSVISCNRAGPNEKKLSTKEFIDRFLTLDEDHG